MSLRAVFAVALAAAALPLATPVAAQAESRDCTLFNSYQDNILELMEQAHGLSTNVDNPAAVAPDIAAIYHTLNVQLSALASQLVSPVLKRQMFAWAGSAVQLEGYFRAMSQRQITQADNDKLTRDIDAFTQGSANFTNGADAACNV